MSDTDLTLYPQSGSNTSGSESGSERDSSSDDESTAESSDLNDGKPKHVMGKLCMPQGTNRINKWLDDIGPNRGMFF